MHVMNRYAFALVVILTATTASAQPAPTDPYPPPTLPTVPTAPYPAPTYPTAPAYAAPAPIPPPADQPKLPKAGDFDAGGQLRLPNGPDENGQYATYNWIVVDAKGR